MGLAKNLSDALPALGLVLRANSSDDSIPEISGGAVKSITAR